MINTYDGYCRSEKNNVLYAYNGTFEEVGTKLTWQADVTRDDVHQWTISGKFTGISEDMVRRVVEDSTKDKIRALAAEIE